MKLKNAYEETIEEIATRLKFVLLPHGEKFLVFIQ